DAIRPEQFRPLVLRIFGDSGDGEDLLALLGAMRIRRIPDDFALVLRTMILLNGLSHRLAPGRRLVQSELLRHLAAGARRRAGSFDRADRVGPAEPVGAASSPAEPLTRRVQSA